MAQQQTTMKIGSAVLADLKEVSAQVCRSPQKQIEHWVAAAKRQAEIEQRIKIVRAVEASEAPEGYDTLAVADPEAHAIEQQQRFIQGDISIQEYINELVRLTRR